MSRIYIKSNQQHTMQPGQLINKLGKYIYKNLDGAYNIKYSPNTCDIDIVVLYEIPRGILQKYAEEMKNVDDSVKEMNININLTTYNNKIRMNLIILDELERTIGQKVYPMDKLLELSMKSRKDLIMKDIFNLLSREFEDYEFIF